MRHSRRPRRRAFCGPICPTSRSSRTMPRVPGPFRTRAPNVRSDSPLREQSLRSPLAPRQERKPLEQMHVLLVLEQRAVQRRNELLRVALAQDFRADILDQQKLEPIEQLRGRRLLLHPRYVADFVKQLERLRHQALLDAGEMHLDDRAHGIGVGEADVVEEAAAQESVGQLLLVVRGDHHDRPPPRLDGFAGLVDEELHAIEFQQQIVGKFDVRLVDFIDQQHWSRIRDEAVPHLAALDVVANVAHALVAELAVAQPPHRVVFVEPLQRLGGRLDLPLDQRRAEALGTPLIEWHIKSTTKALQGLYEYDAVSRLRDSQLGDERVRDIRNYIKRGKLWDAFVADARPVLLIDEIDKADIEFPNDLLLELDRMEFFVYETGETVKPRRRPIDVITSTNENPPPDAFLRRCFFHYIRFPDTDTMQAIVEVHFPGIKQRLVSEALKLFYEIRAVPGMKKKPSTSELLDWLKLLLVEDIGPETLRQRDPKKLIPPFHGALLKNEQDVHLFERLA